MSWEKNLEKLLWGMKPILNSGQYVFVTSQKNLAPNEYIMSFQEPEGITYILTQNTADTLNLEYEYIAAWITLEVHSSLEAVWLTAAFSSALWVENISANVVAWYYHDHIFVDINDAEKAIGVLQELSNTNKKNHMIRRKICFSFLMSFLISGAISLFFTFKNIWFVEWFFWVWIFWSWLYAFAIAFPMAYFLPKYVNTFLEKVAKIRSCKKIIKR